MAYIPELTSFEETLINAYDLSNGPANFTSSNISQYRTFSLQFVGTNLEDSDFFIEQSNNGTDWDEIPNGFIMLQPNQSAFTVERTNFTGKYLRIRFTDTTTGILSAYLIAKK